MTTQTVYPTRHRCPLCGSTLISNGRHIWCSFVGGAGVPGCTYGIGNGGIRVCPRCGGPLDNVLPGFSIVEGGGEVCANCVRPGEEILRAKGL